MVMRQAESAIIIAAMAMAIQRMTKLTKVSRPKYLPDLFNTVIMFIL